MSDRVHIKLHPQGTELDAERGTPLQDLLFPYGVEFPCGGRGRCKGCRVRVLQGNLPVTPDQQRMLSPDELRSGWRLSCQCRAEQDITLELAQWEASILTDETHFTFAPREGLGIAVDLGTTTIVAQLLDLATANVLAVRTALNPQARFGADVMSRVGYAVLQEGQATLVRVIRTQIGRMLLDLLEAAGRAREGPAEIVVVGNTVMHHLFSNLDVEPLSHYPFESEQLGLQAFRSSDLGWALQEDPPVRVLPCIAGYVGSDILAGIVATELHRSPEYRALIDLGTNGEIVLGSRERLVCASTAAGPAFEGARILMGMRAATGAISEVHLDNGRPVCHVLGNVPPRGICGSGLVDAVAAWLELGMIGANGRMTGEDGFLTLCDPVKISQTDVRELQLAKGAVAAGVKILLETVGITLDDVRRVHLAGAFGNYINTTTASRIGLLPFPTEKIHPAGNTALLGAKMALFLGKDVLTEIAGRVDHVSLHAHPAFQELYVEEMSFPRQPSVAR